MFDHYHYRHPGYAKYIQEGTPDSPALAGGLHESLPERKLQPAIAELMGSDISAATMKKIQAERLLADWLELALIRQGPDNERFLLTANGSWYINTMINELREIAALPVPQ
jgi:hypothetical protein